VSQLDSQLVNPLATQQDNRLATLLDSQLDSQPHSQVDNLLATQQDYPQEFLVVCLLRSPLVKPRAIRPLNLAGSHLEIHLLCHLAILHQLQVSFLQQYQQGFHPVILRGFHLDYRVGNQVVNPLQYPQEFPPRFHQESHPVFRHQGRHQSHLLYLLLLHQLHLVSQLDSQLVNPLATQQDNRLATLLDSQLDSQPHSQVDNLLATQQDYPQEFLVVCLLRSPLVKPRAIRPLNLAGSHLEIHLLCHQFCLPIFRQFNHLGNLLVRHRQFRPVNLLDHLQTALHFCRPRCQPVTRLVFQLMFRPLNHLFLRLISQQPNPLHFLLWHLVLPQHLLRLATRVHCLLVFQLASLLVFPVGLL